MKQNYTSVERQRLISLIIDVAMEVHESGIQVAEKIGVPSDVIYDLRQRSPRAAMNHPCECKECSPKNMSVKVIMCDIVGCSAGWGGICHNPDVTETPEDKCEHRY